MEEKDERSTDWIFVVVAGNASENSACRIKFPLICGWKKHLDRYLEYFPDDIVEELLFNVIFFPKRQILELRM